MLPIGEKAQEVIDEWVRNYPDKWVGGVCAFGVYDRDTGDFLTGSRSHGACHAHLTYLGHKDKADKGICVNAHKKQHTQPEFTKWVCREGPFSNAVLNKDKEDEILRHASVIDIEQVGNGGALWLCKALRRFTEDTYKLPWWNQLREQGLNGLQAFIGSDILGMDGSVGTFRTHVSLFAGGSPEQVRKHYDTAKAWKRLDTGEVSQPGGGPNGWGGLNVKTVQKPDGWGGFIEVKQPCDVKAYAAILKEIFEGNPKNVK